MTQRSEQKCQNCYFCDHKTWSGGERYNCRLYPPVKYRDDKFGRLMLLAMAILFFGVVLGASRWPVISDLSPEALVGLVLITSSGLIIQIAYRMLIRRESQVIVESSDWCGQWKAKPSPDKTAWELTLEGSKHDESQE